MTLRSNTTFWRRAVGVVTAFALMVAVVAVPSAKAAVEISGGTTRSTNLGEYIILDKLFSDSGGGIFGDNTGDDSNLEDLILLDALSNGSTTGSGLFSGSSIFNRSSTSGTTSTSTLNTTNLGDLVLLDALFSDNGEGLFGEGGIFNRQNGNRGTWEDLILLEALFGDNNGTGIDLGDLLLLDVIRDNDSGNQTSEEQRRQEEQQRQQQQQMQPQQ